MSRATSSDRALDYVLKSLKDECDLRNRLPQIACKCVQRTTGQIEEREVFRMTSQMRIPPTNRFLLRHGDCHLGHKITSTFFMKRGRGRCFYQGSSQQRRTDMNFETGLPTLCDPIRAMPGPTRLSRSKQNRAKYRAFWLPTTRFSSDDDDQIIAAMVGSKQQSC